MFRKLSRAFGVDRATAFGSLSTVWSVVAGPTTLLLIASHFNPGIQGFYFTFSSLLALTVFAELGLGVVIQQFASHEWSGLSLDAHGRVTGSGDALSRLASLARFAFRWYAVAGAFAAIGLGVVGFVFFSQRPAPGVDWVGPWLALCVLTGLRLLLVPAFSLLDGCDQMQSTNAARLAINVSSSLCGWAALLLGGALWTAVVMNAAGTITSLVFIASRHPEFFRSIRSSTTLAQISWSREVWPMQWKIAVSWLSGYFIVSLFTPVIFQFQGPVAAGQMGMTLSVASTLLALSSIWVSTKAPAFGVLIARRDHEALDRLFMSSTKQAMTVGALGVLLIWAATYGLNAIHHPLAHRLLPPLPVGLFLCSMLLAGLGGAMATYLRAHRREPFLIPSILAGLTMGASTVILGRKYGADGAAIGYFILNVLFLIPEIAIFRYCRLTWHGTPSLTAGGKFESHAAQGGPPS
jgi:hypothetical protein